MAFQIMELALLVSDGNYLAFLRASIEFITGAQPEWPRLDFQIGSLEGQLLADGHAQTLGRN